MVPQCVYLLHFDQPYRHARHYLGWTTDLRARMDRHFEGHGSRLVQVILEEGIGITVARIWWNKGRDFERRLKDAGHGPSRCPICNPKRKGP